MKLFCKVLSVVAQVVLRDAWYRLAHDLAFVYGTYHTSVRSRIPPILAVALIAAEDRRFHAHDGVDPIAIGRAICHLAFRGSVTGGSTIEQQLVRTMTRQRQRTIRRKIREILLACLVHRVIPKSDIPGVYLYIAYFGWRMNGIQEACQRLRIELTSITPRQAASLVARLKYPEPRIAPPQRARRIALRTEYVLKRLAGRVGVTRPAAPAGARGPALAPDAFPGAPWPHDRQVVGQAIVSAAERHGVPPWIALRVAHRESGFNHEARSRAGAIGVMQLMPIAAEELGVNPFDLKQNIDGGVRYLRQKWDRFGDWALALAAYNAGDTAVKSGKWLSYPETRSYVQSILGPSAVPVAVPPAGPPRSPL